MSIINKRSLAWILSCVFVWSGLMCSVATAGARKRTATEYFNEADVSFDVQRNASGGLTIKGKEGRVEWFKVQLTGSDLAGFRGQQKGNFNLTRLSGGLLRFEYKGFSINVSQTGDIEMPDRSVATRENWCGLGKVAIRTSGTLENKGNQKFSSIVTWTNAFHNFGTLHTAEASQLYNNYLCNNGIIHLNNRLGADVEPGGRRHQEPNFTDQAVVNLGTFKVGGKLLIDGGLSYTEQKESQFGDLEMTGGDINVENNGKMNVSGTITGTVRDLGVRARSSLEVGMVALSNPIENLEIAADGKFNIKQTSEVKVNGRFYCPGTLNSAAPLRLRLQSAPEGPLGQVATTSSLRVYCNHPAKTLLVRQRAGVAGQPRIEYLELAPGGVGQLGRQVAVEPAPAPAAAPVKALRAQLDRITQERDAALTRVRDLETDRIVLRDIVEAQDAEVWRTTDQLLAGGHRIAQLENVMRAAGILVPEASAAAYAYWVPEAPAPAVRLAAALAARRAAPAVGGLTVALVASREARIIGPREIHIFSSGIKQIIHWDSNTLTVAAWSRLNGPKENVTFVALGCDITSIAEQAFDHWGRLEQIVLPGGLTIIGNNAFLFCEHLALTHLPEGVINIGNAAFQGCKHLALTHLPEGVEHIGTHAFSCCPMLALDTLPAALTRIANGAFSVCGRLALRALPERVISIGEGAFSSCPMLALTHLPKGVISIDNFAFSSCSMLALTHLPEGVERIGAYAFSGCTNLGLRALPERVKHIGKWAFSSCPMLALTHLPKGVISIGEGAFDNCQCGRWLLLESLHGLDGSYEAGPKTPQLRAGAGTGLGRGSRGLPPPPW